ncbi:MAG: hypothetical protein O2794_00100 [bacterium]|nr:hypothetical protein [bacterium]
MIQRHFSEKVINRQGGQAALVAVVFFLFISLVILGSFTALATSQLSNANELIEGKKSFATMESGIDDITIRALSTGYEYTNVSIGANLYKISYTTSDNFANDGESEIIIDNSDATGDLPLVYDVRAKGDVSSRIRKSFYRFIVPDEKLAVSVKSAIQSGYIGTILNNDTQIHSTAGFNKGDVFSNGSILSQSGRPVVNGNAIVARGVGKIPHQAHNCSKDSVDGVQYCPGSNMGSASPLEVVTFPRAGCDSINVVGGPDNCGGFHVNEWMDGSSDDGQLPARDGAQSFISSITGTIRKIRLLIACHTSTVTSPACLDLKGGLTLEIRPNERVTKDTGNIGFGSWLRGTECSKDPWGRDFIDMNSDGMWEYNDNNGDGQWWPPGGDTMGTEPVDGINWTSDCIDVPDFTGGSPIASVSILKGTLDNLITQKDTYYWVDIELGNVGELTMDTKYWIVIEDGCTNSCLGNDNEYWLIGGTNVEGNPVNYTVGNNLTGDINTAWNYDSPTALSGSSGEEAAFISFEDWTKDVLDSRFVSGGQTYEPFDIAFELFLGEEKTSLTSDSVPNHFSGDKRGESSTIGDHLFIVGDARAEFVSGIDVGGTVYYEEIDDLLSYNEVKAGGEFYTQSYSGTDRIQESHQPPDIPYPQTSWLDIDDINFAGLKRHLLKSAQYACPDDFDPVPPPGWPTGYSSYNQGENWNRLASNWRFPAPTNINAIQWGASCDSPYYTSDNRWSCWDQFCSCNNGGGAAYVGQNNEVEVHADSSSDDPDGGVDDVFCENVDDEAKYEDDLGTDDDPIPPPEQAFGVNGVVLNTAKLEQLKKKAMSLGIQDITSEPSGAISLSSPAGVAGTTTWPGITPHDPNFGLHPLCDPPHSPQDECDGYQYWNIYNREEFVKVNGTEGYPLYGGYIIGDVTIPTETGVRLAGRITQEIYDGYWKDATTTLESSMVGKCPYNVRHDGEVIGGGTVNENDPCYVLWITGDLVITGGATSITALPPDSATCANAYGIYGPPETCSATDLEYSMFIIVEGDVNISQGSHIYGFPHPEKRSGIFIVSLEQDTGSSEGAIQITGKARGSAFFGYRGTLTGSQSTHIKALVAAGIKTSGSAEIFFDEGLKSPFTESGGSQLTGANIDKYREVD